MNLSEEDLDTVKQMAGLNQSWRQIAKYLGIHATTFKNEWDRPESELRNAYDEGLYNTEVDIRIQIQENAIAGNLTAIEMHRQYRKAQRLEELKDILLYGG